MTRLPVGVRDPATRRLAVGGLLSETADWALVVALPLLVLRLTGSTLVTAAVFTVQLLPTVVAAPFAGVLVDRAEPWRLMAGVAGLQAVALPALLLVEDRGDLWLCYAVALVQSVLGTVIEPCRGALAAAVAPPGELLAVNQVTGVLASVARLVGGPLGGLLIGAGAPTALVGAAAGAYLLTAALFTLRVPSTPPQTRPGRGRRPGVWRDWRDGVQLVGASPVLRRGMAVTAVLAAAQGAFVVLFVTFVLRDLAGSDADVGLLRGVQAIGALAGGVLLGRVAGRWGPARVLTGALVAFGALSLTIWNAPALTTSIGLYLALFAVVGAPGLLATTALMTLLQTDSPPGARGRVLSTFGAVHGGAQAVGILLAGTLGTGMAMTVGLQVQGCLFLVAALLAVGFTRRASRPEDRDRGAARAPA